MGVREAGMDAQLLRIGPRDSQWDGARAQHFTPKKHQPWREFGRRAQFSEDSLTVVLEMLQRWENVIFNSQFKENRKTTRIEVSLNNTYPSYL